MDPMDYYLIEEFILPEAGGVTGTRQINCPYCDMGLELTVNPTGAIDRYVCENCEGMFEVDWTIGQVRYNPG